MILLQFAVKVNTTNCGYLYCTLDKKKGREVHVRAYPRPAGGPGPLAKQLSQALHCSQQVYSNYELGQRDIPTAILIALADFYDTSTDYILGRTDEK